MSTRQLAQAGPAKLSFTPIRTGLLQRKCDCGNTVGPRGECEECRKKKPQPAVLRHSTISPQPSEVTPIAHEVLRSPGQPLDTPTDRLKEPRFGHDFSRVPTLQKWRPTLPKLAINVVGDRFEQEADRVAMQVMRMPQTNADSVTETVPQPRLQRQHAAPFGGRLEEASASGQSGPIDDQNLSSGGEVLSSSLQSFYEKRFGRDFSQVRVHVGDDAIKRNDAVNAHAFTYGSHIWLGPDLGLTPSMILAHELAHVVQQTQPPKKVATESELQLVGDVSSPRQIQRFAPYWEPFDYNGTRTHSEVLPLLGKESRIFTEAPVPNAQRDKLGAGSAAAFGKKGFADFYSASTTVGIYFEQSADPKTLPSGKDTKKDGEKFPHAKTAAPNLESANTVGRVDKAPTEVKVGDLKPSHGTLEAAEGPDQVKSYLKGFELAASEVNLLPPVQRKPAGGTWKLTTNPLGSKDVQIPAKYQHPNASGQTPQKLVIKHEARKPLAPSKPTPGKLFVVSGKGGIWNYFWQPDITVQASDLPKELSTLHKDLQQYLIGPLLASPVKKKPKLRATPPAAPPIVNLTPDHRGVITRKGVADDPSFDLVKWKADHKRLTQVEAAAEKTSDFKEAEFNSLAAKAQTATKESTGAAIPEIPSQTKAASSNLGKIKFWTGSSSAIFGPARKLFGGAFVKVAQFYQKTRDKLAEKLRQSSKEQKNALSIQDVAKNVFLRVLKVVATYMLKQTAQHLIDSLEKGVSAKLQKLFAGEMEELEEKVKEVEQIKKDLELSALDEVEDLVESTIGPYQDVLAKLQEVQKIASDIQQIVSWIQWAMRVAELAECATIIGCLAAIGQELGKVAFAKFVIGSCWFQRKIIPVVTGIDFVQKLPLDLAKIIVDNIKKRLPKSLEDVLQDVDVSGVAVKSDDIDCKDLLDEGEAEEPQARAELYESILELRREVGDETLKAFGEFLNKYGLSTVSPPTVDSIRQIRAALLESKITAEEIRRFMAMNGFLPFAHANLGDLMKKVKIGAGPVPGPAKPPGKSSGPRFGTPPGKPGDSPGIRNNPLGGGVEF